MGFRITRAEGPLTDRWRTVPVESRGATRIGISFRPLQAEGLGLDPSATLKALLEHSFQVVRLAALWTRMEPAPDVFDPSHLDWQRPRAPPPPPPPTPPSPPPPPPPPPHPPPLPPP